MIGYTYRFTGNSATYEDYEFDWGVAPCEEMSAAEARSTADRLGFLLESGEVRRSLQADLELAKAEAAAAEASYNSDQTGLRWLHSYDDISLSVQYRDVDAWEEVLRDWVNFLRDCGGFYAYR